MSFILFLMTIHLVNYVSVVAQELALQLEPCPEFMGQKTTTNSYLCGGPCKPFTNGMLTVLTGKTSYNKG